MTSTRAPRDVQQNPRGAQRAAHRAPHFAAQNPAARAETTPRLLPKPSTRSDRSPHARRTLGCARRRTAPTRLRAQERFGTVPQAGSQVFDNSSYAVLNMDLDRVGAIAGGTRAQRMLDLGDPSIDLAADRVRPRRPGDAVLGAGPRVRRRHPRRESTQRDPDPCVRDPALDPALRHLHGRRLRRPQGTPRQESIPLPGHPEPPLHVHPTGRRPAVRRRSAPGRRHRHDRSATVGTLVLYFGDDSSAARAAPCPRIAHERVDTGRYETTPVSTLNRVVPAQSTRNGTRRYQADGPGGFCNHEVASSILAPGSSGSGVQSSRAISRTRARSTSSAGRLSPPSGMITSA